MNMNKNIAAVIVSYNPDNSITLLYNSIKEQVGELIIIDNCSTEENSKKILEELSKEIKIIFNDKNLGVAAALNQAAEYAVKHNYKWLLTLDQDSEFLPYTYDKMLNSYEKMEGKNKIMILAPSYKQIFEKSDDWKHYNDKKTINKKDIIWKQKILNLTSGSLIKTESFKYVGFFDETLFIEQVDNDFCYRLKKAGYKIRVAQNIYFLHKIGNAENKYGIIVRNHLPMRKYYLARNTTIMIKRYFFAAPYTTTRYFLGGTILGWTKILLFEKNKFEKIKSGLKGFFEAIY